MRLPADETASGDSPLKGLSLSRPQEPTQAARLGDAWGIFLVGGALAVAGVVTVLGEHASDDVITALFYCFMGIVLPLAVIGAGYYLVRWDFTRDDVRHVTGWFLGGIAFLWFIYLWSNLPYLLGDGTFIDVRSGLVLSGNLGSVVGLIAGVNRARARQNRRLVERSEGQQDTLEFINHLLRHNILNGLQVIDGYAAMLDDHVDAEGRDHLDRIQGRTHHMTDLTDNVRVLMRTFTGDGFDCVPVDLSATLQKEVDVARSAFSTATVETDIPGGVHVEANDLVGAVFENLLANAVVHNDGTDPHVEVTLREREGVAEVRIADDGPGISDGLRQVYLREGERPADTAADGLGLYLVDALVEAFGGSFDLESADGVGTTAVVRLPLAEAPEETPAGEAPPPVEATLDD